MNSNLSGRLIALGRLLFGIALVAWGVQHLAAGDFVTRVVPSWPAWIPGRAMWAYLVGALLIAAGVAIVLDVKARIAAIAFGGLAFLSFVFLHVPLAARDMVLGGAWTSAGKALVMCGGALCVAVSLTDGTRNPSSDGLSSARVRQAIIIWGRLCLGAFMILCGIQHFMFAGFVASLVPSWIPGAMFWTYFAGAALIAGGAGIIAPFVTWLAALLSGVMIFSWVFLVHVPLVMKDPHKAGDVAAVFEALAFSGVAFLLAGLVSRPRAATRPGFRTQH
ncbi:MAG: DoxX family membrane protein [Acidobacteriota bacterium]